MTGPDTWGQEVYPMSSATTKDGIADLVANARAATTSALLRVEEAQGHPLGKFDFHLGEAWEALTAAHDELSHVLARLNA